MPHLVIPALLLASVALVPSAKADVIIYDVRSSLDAVHVTFQLPMFEQLVVNQTVLSSETWDKPLPITSFNLSGGSSSCIPGGASGPCWSANNATDSASTSVSPLFNGPGTFTISSGGVNTTVTITDIPEPSGLVLVSSGLLGIGLMVGNRRLRRRS
jgi:hypothetical protein